MMIFPNFDVHNARLIRERGFAALTKELGAVGTVYSALGFNTPPLAAVRISNTDKKW
jgi:hypothetical protein